MNLFFRSKDCASTLALLKSYGAWGLMCTAAKWWRYRAELFWQIDFYRCVNYLEIPTEGTVILADVTTNAHDRREMAKLREDVGMVSQNYTPFPHMTILRNITFAPVKLGA